MGAQPRGRCPPSHPRGVKPPPWARLRVPPPGCGLPRGPSPILPPGVDGPRGPCPPSCPRGVDGPRGPCPPSCPQGVDGPRGPVPRPFTRAWASRADPVPCAGPGDGRPPWTVSRALAAHSQYLMTAMLTGAVQVTTTSGFSEAMAQRHCKRSRQPAARRACTSPAARLASREAVALRPISGGPSHRSTSQPMSGIGRRTADSGPAPVGRRPRTAFAQAQGSTQLRSSGTAQAQRSAQARGVGLSSSRLGCQVNPKVPVGRRGRGPHPEGLYAQAGLRVSGSSDSLSSSRRKAG